MSVGKIFATMLLHAAKATGRLNAFYWYQILALDSAVDEAQKMLSSHGGFLTIAMYHHGETIESN